jgi:hypothetical protein
MRLKLLCTSFLFSIISTFVTAETWDCKQLRDVLVGPPYYVDQEETDEPFSIKVAGSAITVASDDSQVFECDSEDCRQHLSAQDFLINGNNDESYFILSSVGGSMGFKATYSITSKPSVGETMIQMGVCSPSVNESGE